MKSEIIVLLLFVLLFGCNKPQGNDDQNTNKPKNNIAKFQYATMVFTGSLYNYMLEPKGDGTPKIFVYYGSGKTETFKMNGGKNDISIGDFNIVTERLNYMGAQGWELIGVEAAAQGMITIYNLKKTTYQ